jgi:hypothetical protein
VIADVHSGSVFLKLDNDSSKTVISDTRWESNGASAAANRYEIRINSGVVRLTLDSAASKTSAKVPLPIAEPATTSQPVSALEILLDGVEARVRGR